MFLPVSFLGLVLFCDIDLLASHVLRRQLDARTKMEAPHNCMNMKNMHHRKQRQQ
ncbi:unnamed protein product [Laminaria digitata]